MNVFCKLSFYRILKNKMCGIRFALDKQIFNRVRFNYFITSYYLDILSTMTYFTRFDFSFNVRSTVNYATIKNENKLRRLEFKQIFNNIIIDKNINFFNNSFDPLHNFNFFNNNPDLFIQFIFTRKRYLQDIIFALNDRTLSKRVFKHRVVDIQNENIAKSTNTLI